MASCSKLRLPGPPHIMVSSFLFGTKRGFYILNCVLLQTPQEDSKPLGTATAVLPTARPSVGGVFLATSYY